MSAPTDGRAVCDGGPAILAETGRVAARPWWAPIAAALVVVLGVGALVLEVRGSSAADDTAALPASEPDPAPAPAAEPRPPTEIDLAAGWPIARDRALIEEASEDWRLAFEDGSRAGFTAMAEASWPPGLTADAILACKFSEPTPSYAELDDRGFTLWLRTVEPQPDPRWRYPPTGEPLSSYGLRVYRVIAQEVVTSSEEDENRSSEPFPAHVAVGFDGVVVQFPQCFEYLPGGEYAHRVTDGEVGGYTDDEQWGDLLLGFRNLGPIGQQDFCDEYRERGAKATRDWFVDENYFPPTLTVEVVREFLDPRCPAPTA
jgi:hypothetical protein